MIARVLFTVLTAALAAASSNAQTAASSGGWPSKPIKLIVPFPGGSSTDRRSGGNRAGVSCSAFSALI